MSADLTVDERRVFNMIHKRGKVSCMELGEVFSRMPKDKVTLRPVLAKLFELGWLEKTGPLDVPSTFFYLSADGLMTARKAEHA